MRHGNLARELTPPLLAGPLRRLKQSLDVWRFRQGGMIPHAAGYVAYRKRFIMNTLGNPDVLDLFRQGRRLPEGFGMSLDERCVEYPWLFSRIGSGPATLLDAGSCLNFDFILSQPGLQGKTLHILTLAPEEECHWNLGASYLFADLRDIPMRSDFYDAVACLSTLEHLGCDNRVYSGKPEHREHDPVAFVEGMQQIRRVLKPQGRLFLTVPYGARRFLGFMQQFDREILARSIEAFGQTRSVHKTFFRYSKTGWDAAEEADCAQCQYVEWSAQHPLPSPLPVEPDRAAAARAVACVELVKG